MDGHQIRHLRQANGYQPKPFCQHFSAHNNTSQPSGNISHQPASKTRLLSTRPENNLDAHPLRNLDCRRPVIAFKY
jgi:hypothetical protein